MLVELFKSKIADILIVDESFGETGLRIDGEVGFQSDQLARLICTLSGQLGDLLVAWA